MFTRPPGVEDIFPDRIEQWNFIINSAKTIFSKYNYREIVIPVMEFTEVFARGLGDDTDIVSKEMFTFEDRGGRSLTLRPEGTASVVRAYVENGEYNRLASCKLFYTGPMFRAERPQKGRLRQFNQFGAEFFGSEDPYYDYEVIAMMDEISRLVRIKNYSILVNSIGCSHDRDGYIAELKKYYTEKKDRLCDDCKKRLEKNTLRLLDCKVEGCKELKTGAPVITSHLCTECKDHHDRLKSYLSENKINFTEDPFLVRGLDYYTRTTFEFVTDQLGGQNAFAAGGRYDSLVEQFGGKPTPAVGFAAGIERLCLLTEGNTIPASPLYAYIIHSGGDSLNMAVSLAGRIRSAGVSADLDPAAKGFKSQFKKADREKARFACIIGEDEAKAKSCTIKNMETGEQQTVKLDQCLNHLLDVKLKQKLV